MIQQLADWITYDLLGRVFKIRLKSDAFFP